MDKKATSGYTRLKVCAEDNRTSSKGMGLIGIVILALTVLFILFIDCVGLCIVFDR